MLRRCHTLRLRREHSVHLDPARAIGAHLGIETAGVSAQRQVSVSDQSRRCREHAGDGGQRGMPVTVISIDAKFAGSDSSHRARENHMCVVNTRIAASARLYADLDEARRGSSYVTHSGCCSVSTAEKSL